MASARPRRHRPRTITTTIPSDLAHAQRRPAPARSRTTASFTRDLAAPVRETAAAPSGRARSRSRRRGRCGGRGRCRYRGVVTLAGSASVSRGSIGGASGSAASRRGIVWPGRRGVPAVGGALVPVRDGGGSVRRGSRGGTNAVVPVGDGLAAIRDSTARRATGPERDYRYTEPAPRPGWIGRADDRPARIERRVSSVRMVHSTRTVRFDRVVEADRVVHPTRTFRFRRVVNTVRMADTDRMAGFGRVVGADSMVGFGGVVGSTRMVACVWWVGVRRAVRFGRVAGGVKVAGSLG
ncbi:hypothetical protein BJ982_007144 [Sphaerisporangium siamense]|uniref:Uncharacterized protein n=1 Tax=Sphaerisporangium siamense TaxID=795645 RepID=A0A7W7DEW3_9ACTN|nr:hypothetical protein [Sphaerisporangium siamense]